MLIIFLVILPALYIGRKAFLLINAYHTENMLCKNIIILSAENELLRKRIDYYRAGTLLEAKARDDLGMVKRNESIYLLKK